jgi:caffeoyl-CoA O-methyltransferase
MNNLRLLLPGGLGLALCACIAVSSLLAQRPKSDSVLDAKVKTFLDRHSGQWRDWNVPPVDGQTLYNLITKNNYKRALEIGTSTGLSGIWIGWALSKTGGRLITIELDETRHKVAMANFKEAGLADYIDARLADAHTLVPTLSGSFDFVFSDADKEWYKNYFLAVEPMLSVGGCFTAHNVHPLKSGSGGFGGGPQEFLAYVESLPQYETTVNSFGGGLSISFKKKGK